MSMRVAGKIVHVVRVTSCQFDYFNLLYMKFKFLLSAVCSLTTLSIALSAQNLSELVTLLDSGEMSQRTEARNSIQQLLTNSTAPTADASARMVLELSLIHI